MTEQRKTNLNFGSMYKTNAKGEEFKGGARRLVIKDYDAGVNRYYMVMPTKKEYRKTEKDAVGYIRSDGFTTPLSDMDKEKYAAFLEESGGEVTVESKEGKKANEQGEAKKQTRVSDDEMFD